MFRIIITLFLSFPFTLYASNFKASDLTVQDIQLLKQIKNYGTQYDLAYSLMAIAIKESSLGRYQVNVDSYDYGLYQANINTVVKRHEVANNSFNRNKLAMLLIKDFKFATSNAIAELMFWKSVHGENWLKIWASYNAGFNYDSSRAIKYSNDIKAIISELKHIEALNS